MTIDPSDLPPSGFFGRIVNLVRAPQAEWDRIGAEPTKGGVFRGHVLPLALVGAAAGAIGAIVFAHTRWQESLVNAAFQLVTVVLGVFLAALIANLLAPSFGARRDGGRAYKLAAYSATAALLAGVFAILPAIAWLGVLGLYSLALLYIGLPRMMGAPEEKRLPYFALIVVLAIIAVAVLGALTQPARRAILALPFFVEAPEDAAEAAAPAVSGINLEPLQRGALPRAVDPARLEGFLPPSLPGGFTRTTLASAATAAGAEATAAYVNGAARLNLVVAQLNGAAGVSAFVTGANIQQSRTDESGHIRTETLQSRLISEEISQSGAVRYIIIGRGVALIAEGSGGATIDQARAALETLGVERVENAVR